MLTTQSQISFFHPIFDPLYFPLFPPFCPLFPLVITILVSVSMSVCFLFVHLLFSVLYPTYEWNDMVFDFSLAWTFWGELLELIRTEVGHPSNLACGFLCSQNLLMKASTPNSSMHKRNRMEGGLWREKIYSGSLKNHDIPKSIGLCLISGAHIALPVSDIPFQRKAWVAINYLWIAYTYEAYVWKQKRN